MLWKAFVLILLCCCLTSIYVCTSPDFVGYKVNLRSIMERPYFLGNKAKTLTFAPAEIP